jgi:hypothetical protein
LPLPLLVLGKAKIEAQRRREAVVEVSVYAARLFARQATQAPSDQSANGDDLVLPVVSAKQRKSFQSQHG